MANRAALSEAITSLSETVPISDQIFRGMVEPNIARADADAHFAQAMLLMRIFRPISLIEMSLTTSRMACIPPTCAAAKRIAPPENHGSLR